MAAALELFPIFARAHLLRTWAGVVDTTPDASPIVGLTPGREPLPQLRLGHRRLQGHSRRRLVFRPHRGPRQAASLIAPFTLERFTTGALVDEHGAAAVAH